MKIDKVAYNEKEEVYTFVGNEPISPDTVKTIKIAVTKDVLTKTLDSLGYVKVAQTEEDGIEEANYYV
jgi:hypothetical protein